MVNESAFYTVSLYERCRRFLAILVGVSVTVAVLAGAVAASSAIPEHVSDWISTLILALIPAIVSMNLIGHWLMLGRSISAIKGIERELRKLRKSDGTVEHEVLRFVAEYDCQVSNGFPILNRLFHRWHPSIRERWDSANPDMPAGGGSLVQIGSDPLKQGVHSKLH